MTHKGAAADAGHYIGFVKKSVFHATKSASASASDVAVPGSPMNISAPSGAAAVGIDEEDEDWYKFDDDKVSVFPKEKLGTLDGGGQLYLLVFKSSPDLFNHSGEDSSAYVLVYKSKPLV